MFQSVADTAIVDHLGTVVLAAGALGTAAFGIVEASKWLSVVGEAGFGSAMKMIGALQSPLKVAYGERYDEMLRGQYRGDQRELVRVLRQGVRVGITRENAGEVAKFLGSIDGSALATAVAAAEVSGELSADSRNVIGRYELAADARIDAALTVAQANYAGVNRVLASIVSIGIALGVGNAMNLTGLAPLIVGVAAVPLAPIAKDVATGIQAARQRCGVPDSWLQREPA